jgi:hypothetical protein
VSQPTATRAGSTGTSGATATPTALLSPAEAAWPTAEPCGDEPTIRVLAGGAWVYEGPGQDYDAIGRLEEDTVRPLLARGEPAQWWLITLEDEERGWIADEDVDVQGDTSELAVEEPPALPDGNTPTPGPTWEPTPNPDCSTPTATPTPSPSPAPSSTATPTTTPTEQAEDVTATTTAEPTAAGEAEPLPVEDEGSSLMWLPIAGLVLLAAGVFLYVTRRS